VYCGFYSTTGKTDLQEIYAKAVMRELDLRAYYINNVRVHTMYIGGGTPSYMRTHLLTNIINAIKKKQGIEEGDIEEFTIECNPDDVTEEFAKTIVGMGVNRVSLGVQSFSDERLRFLRRRHNAAQAAIGVQTLRRHGIRNISIDLMFGFPDETLSEWQKDIRRAIELDVEHISAYSLMYEEGTPLYRMLAEGKVKECDEALSTKMYDVLMEMLEKAGYEHYEISNFAKTGYRSKHNSSYWNDSIYLGLGAAAHSYNRKSRQWNIGDIEKYIETIENGEIPAEKELIDPATHYNDTITTVLRTKEGIDITKVEEPYKSYLLKNAEKAIASGNLQIKGERISLTRQGLYISDSIMADLIWI
jgi:oxygen-independent coproporphyrinogen-3 oxidase